MSLVLYVYDFRQIIIITKCMTLCKYIFCIYIPEEEEKQDKWQLAKLKGDEKQEQKKVKEPQSQDWRAGEGDATATTTASPRKQCHISKMAGSLSLSQLLLFPWPVATEVSEHSYSPFHCTPLSLLNQCHLVLEVNPKSCSLKFWIIISVPVFHVSLYWDQWTQLLPT